MRLGVFILKVSCNFDIVFCMNDLCCIEKLIGTELLQVFMSFLIDFRISFSDRGCSNFSMKFALQSAKKRHHLMAQFKTFLN